MNKGYGKLIDPDTREESDVAYEIEPAFSSGRIKGALPGFLTRDGWMLVTEEGERYKVAADNISIYIGINLSQEWVPVTISK